MPDNNLFEVAIAARATWNLHSLNNEGTVGNVTEPRTVVLAGGDKTDGVSGEMLKHIHAYYLWMLESDKSKFCPACRKLHPQKADENPDVTRVRDGAEAMSIAIKTCEMDDVHGFLVQRPTISRSSTIEFGWIVGIPESTNRDIHIHARHWMGGRDEQTQANQSEEGQEQQTREVSAQMIYHRPTRSGVYAIVSVFQPWRIGLNETNYSYVIDQEERKRRSALALNAYKATFMHPEGAMDSTRLPHIEGFEGAVIISEKNFPAPALSPLAADFIDRIEALANRVGLKVRTFSNLDVFCTIMDELGVYTPWTLELPTS